MRTTRSSMHHAAPRLYALAALGFVFLWPELAFSQVDCTMPAKLSVSQVRGQVFDPFGIAVPAATVSLIPKKGHPLQTKADGDGRFEINAPVGRYALKVEEKGFALSSAQLNVGRIRWGVIHRQELRVMLGFAGSYCPWVTTSKREFLSIVHVNLKRLKESAQTHATQK